ncbi:MAG: ATP-binding protein [Acidobacteria bacterium]|nr:ATP-binding protein [Acidobacteriota bacterium]
MKAFGSNLKRRIWQPFFFIILAALAAAVFFTISPRPSPVVLWSYTVLLILLVLVVGGRLVRRIVEAGQELAKAAEQLSPGTLDKASEQSGEITALVHTVNLMTSELRQKEQTWIGDLEQRTQAVQQMSKTLQEQATSFETALNSVDLAVCLFDSNGNILQVNQRFCGFLGTEQAKLKSMDLLQVASELQNFVSAPDELTAAAEAIFREPSAPRDTNVALQDRSGNLRIYCVPIFGEMSSLVGIVISPGESADSSAVDRLKTEFISTVSHELRTPLTAIKGALGLVLGGAGGPVSARIRELLEIASNNTDRLIRLVNDILEVFRMETGKLKLRPEIVGVSEMVNQACGKVKQEAAAAGIRLELHVTPDMLPALVDAEQVQLVLENLLSNAIKFSSRGGVVRIAAEPMQTKPKFMTLSVQDFGVGIPSEAQQRIFGKFEQAESVMTRQHQGSGLGLAICRGIVEGHGGRIWVDSELGKGSTFFISLPLAQSQTMRKASPAAKPASLPQPGAHHLVMVVDDDTDTRNVLSRMLQSQGHFVLEVGNGLEAADLAARHRPEVITLDLIMPEVDGLEVLRTLKANSQTRQIPVICVSISDELSAEALQSGAVQFIQKPLEPATLLSAINAVCGTGSGSAESGSPAAAG